MPSPLTHNQVSGLLWRYVNMSLYGRNHGSGRDSSGINPRVFLCTICVWRRWLWQLMRRSAPFHYWSRALRLCGPSVLFVLVFGSEFSLFAALWELQHRHALTSSLSVKRRTLSGNAGADSHSSLSTLHRCPRAENSNENKILILLFVICYCWYYLTYGRFISDLFFYFIFLENLSTIVTG